MKVVKTTMTMMNKCQEQLDFKLNINCVSLTEHINNLFQTAIVCLQTKSSLGALWELSGSSLQLRVLHTYLVYNTLVRLCQFLLL